ncbi:MAG: GNAT family N-acetyltransferase [Euryarchaeota archaeon]|nr:GNAT family N-acetyltransferase [Euryarchaeota archaeon]
MDRFSLRDYYRWSLEPGNLVFLAVRGRSRLAVCRLIVTDDARGRCIVLEMLAVEATEQGKGIGLGLISVAESISASLGASEIRLEALGEETVDWYTKVGYFPYGSAQEDPDWGRLTPMRKRLPSGTRSASSEHRT